MTGRRYADLGEAPLFQKIVWNEYCVVFPDGRRFPFDEQVRYTALKGWLRKRKVVSAGKAEFMLQFGTPKSGWQRHYIHLDLERLAWFEDDPNFAMTASKVLKLNLLQGKGIDSLLFELCDCALYQNHEDMTQFALGFDNKVLLMQAGTETDARDWIVAIASCLYFGSSAFMSLLRDCQSFFSLALLDSGRTRLSAVEVVDLLRAMGRRASFDEVVAQEAKLGVDGFGMREFIQVVRTVCSDADPHAELTRALRLFGGEQFAQMPAAELVNALASYDIPAKSLALVLRLACTADGVVDCAKLAAVLHPALSQTPHPLPETPRRSEAQREAAARRRAAEQSQTQSQTPRPPSEKPSLMGSRLPSTLSSATLPMRGPRPMPLSEPTDESSSERVLAGARGSPMPQHPDVQGTPPAGSPLALCAASGQTARVVGTSIAAQRAKQVQPSPMTVESRVRRAKTSNAASGLEVDSVFRTGSSDGRLQGARGSAPGSASNLTPRSLPVRTVMRI